MRIITPTYEVLDHPDQFDTIGVLKYIEKIGRVCYKSEDKITDESAVAFCEKLRNSHHWAMLEHYRFTILTSAQVYDDIVNLVRHTDPKEAPLKMLYHYLMITCNPDRELPTMITFSATALNNLVCTRTLRMAENVNHPINQMFQYLLERFAPLMEIPPQWKTPEMTMPIQPVMQADLKKLPKQEASLHGWMSVLFTVSRGTTHETVRCRNHVSYAQESTRYCNYSNGKFNNEITVIIPPDIDLGTPLGKSWQTGCEMAERFYFDMLKEGASPQIAREILPHALKADLVVTAPYEEWKWFFRLRCPKSAHPAIRQVAQPVLQEMIQRPETQWIFSSFDYLLKESN